MPDKAAPAKLITVTTMRGARFHFEWLVFSLAGALISFLAVHFTPLYWFSAKVTDGVLQRTRVPFSPDLVLVVIDDASLQALGRFPFDRRLYAQLIDRLREAGAKAIAFDLLFVEPTPSDAFLAQAMKRFGKVVLGVNLSRKGEGKLPSRLLLTPPSALPLRVTAVTLPPEPLLNACAAVGFVYPFPDRDGVCRTLPLLVQQGQSRRAIPSLALASVMVWKGLPKLGLKALRWSDRQIRLGADWDVPVLPPPSPGRVGFPNLSFVQVLQGDFDRTAVRGKLVLVGMAASGLTDRLPTPTDPLAYGVEIHAAAINALLTGWSLHQVPLSGQFLAVLLLGILFGVVAFFRRPRLCWLAFGFSVVSAYVVPLGLLRVGLIFPPLPLFLASLFSFLVVMGLLLEAQWKHIKQIQAFLARPITEELLAAPERFRTGERREVTVLFSDIRGFTPIAAMLPPYEVVALLSSYFTRMTEIVQLYGGVVDKFLGDGMMVLFGVLPNQDDHPQRAVLCAWQMVEELSTVNWEWEQMTGTPLRIGIGIHTGSAILGEIGSEWRKELTALGATVNLAQRLEQLTKEVGATLLISESTYERVAPLVVAEPVGPLTVRGLEHPVAAYQVQGLTERGREYRRSLWQMIS